MRRVIALLVLATAAGVIFTACASDSKKASGAGSAAAVRLQAVNFSFTPTAITLQSGKQAKITITNAGTVEHNLTVEGLKVNTDVKAGKTAVVSLTPKAGTYPFHCEYHPDLMKGTITVS